MARPTPLLTLSAAARAVAAIRLLLSVIRAMNCKIEGDRPSEEECQAALAEAESALKNLGLKNLWR